MHIQLPASADCIRHTIFRLESELLPPRLEIEVMHDEKATAEGFSQIADLFVTRAHTAAVQVRVAASIAITATFHTKHQLVDVMATLQRFSRHVTINATFGDTFSSGGIAIM